MFETQIQDSSFGGWLAQQILAVLVPAVWALATANLPTILVWRLGYPLGNIAETIWYVVFVWGIGFVLALLVQRLFPRAAATGRWVWPVPTLFFLLWFVGLAVMRSFRYALAAFFYPGPNGEAWWGVAIITYPTCQCALYSFGMFFATRWARQHRVSTSPSGET
jgi:hypothetical protein